MDFNTKMLIGKVRTYNDITGEIVSKDGLYLFTTEDIIDNENLCVEDIVTFRGEEIHGSKRAYFIRKVTPKKELNENSLDGQKVFKLMKEND